MPSDIERPATIYTVAAHANVSIATVSRVLQRTTPTSDSIREKVLQAVDELGYKPKRSYHTTLRVETHGLVLPGLGGPYYSDLLAGYESSTPVIGQGVMLLQTWDLPDVHERVLDLASKVDGLAITQATVDDDVVLALARRLPVVTFARDQVRCCDALSVDNTEPAAELARHLMSHGRRHIQFAGDPHESRDVGGRYAGYLQALSEAGLPAHPEPISVPFEEAAGRLVVERLLSRLRDVDAIMCANDELALAVQQHLQGYGVRIPDDVAVTGWDDILAARYSSPALTTVRQPIRELGRMVAERLHLRIDGSDAEAEQFVLDSAVVLRASCGCDLRA